VRYGKERSEGNEDAKGENIFLVVTFVGTCSSKHILPRQKPPIILSSYHLGRKGIKEIKMLKEKQFFLAIFGRSFASDNILPRQKLPNI
jgi:hypothetical protein